ncbi:cytochrome P450 [Enterobacter sp. Cy-643]|uniref:cytochrome P450 n=1 Tax=Enterobacter sp. Cy-643 TaxID=2608346 RepID=UPI00336A262C
MLTRYQDICQVLKDRTFLSSGIPEDLHAALEKQDLILSPALRSILYGIVLLEDGDVHREHRQALQAVLSGEAWAELSLLVASKATMLIEKLPDERLIDGIGQIAAPLWAELFPAWLNLSAGEQRVVAQEKSAIRLLLDPSGIDSTGLARLLTALSNLDSMFCRLCLKHQTGHDSLFYRSLLKGYGGDTQALAQRFSTDCITMLIGGSETSEALSGNMLFMLAKYPELQAGIRTQSVRIKDVVSETMRFESPLQMARRRVGVPVTLHGRRLLAGDNVLLCLGSANRDETVFEDASRFIPGRKNAQRQLGFGTGAHQCIGQLLAQLQAEHLAALLCARGSFSLDGQAEWSRRSMILRTLNKLPLRMTKS